MTVAQVIAQINQVIIANNNQEITANVLNPVLRAIVNSLNDKIGDLTQLDSEDQTSLVAAFNELAGSINQGGGTTIHQGSNNPNIIPPQTYGITDYYLQAGTPTVLWQYNGNEWIIIQGQKVSINTVLIDIQDWNGDVDAQALALNPQTGSGELTYLYAFKPYGEAENIKFERYVWVRVDENNIFFIGKSISSSLVFDLGEIQSNPIEEIVNISGPFTIPSGTSNLFKTLRNNVPYFYLYLGEEEVIGSGESQTVNSDFVEITEADTFPSSGAMSDLEIKAAYHRVANEFTDEEQSKVSNLPENTNSALQGKEDSLGNPTTDGDILSSTVSGVRTWITPPSGGGGAWGSITGTLADQTDLNTALSAKEKKRTRKNIPNTDEYIFVPEDLTDHILYTLANNGEEVTFILNEGVAPIGGSLQIITEGNNTPIFTGGTGVILNHPPGTELKGTGKGGWIGIIHSGSDVFDINGNLVGASGDFADARLSNIVEDLTEAEKTAIKDKLGVIEGGGIFEGNVWRPEIKKENTAEQNADLINAAITSAKAVKGTVILPALNFSSRTIQYDPRVKLIGYGIGATIINSAAAETLINYSGSTFQGDAFIKGMTLLGGVDENNRVGTKAINIGMTAQFSIIDVRILHFTSIGVDLKGALIGRIENLFIRYCSTGVRGTQGSSDNIGLLKPNLVVFRNCTIGHCSLWGVDWSSGASVHFDKGCNIEYNGTSGDANTGAIKFIGGAHVDDVFGLSIDGTWFEQNKGTLIKIASSAAGTLHRISNTLGGNGTKINAIELDKGKLVISESDFRLDTIKVINGYLEIVNTSHGIVTLQNNSKHRIHDIAVRNGKVFNLGNRNGEHLNYSLPGAYTEYEVTNIIEGGWAISLINASSEPKVWTGNYEVDGTTKIYYPKISGAVFKVDTDMEMVVEVKNGNVRYFFLDL